MKISEAQGTSTKEVLFKNCEEALKALEGENIKDDSGNVVVYNKIEPETIDKLKKFFQDINQNFKDSLPKLTPYHTCDPLIGYTAKPEVMVFSKEFHDAVKEQLKLESEEPFYPILFDYEIPADIYKLFSKETMFSIGEAYPKYLQYLEKDVENEIEVNPPSQGYIVAYLKEELNKKFTEIEISWEYKTSSLTHHLAINKAKTNITEKVIQRIYDDMLSLEASEENVKKILLDLIYNKIAKLYVEINSFEL